MLNNFEIDENCTQIYLISLQGGALPYSVAVARQVPIPLLPKIKKQLDNLTKGGFPCHVNFSIFSTFQ